MTKWRNDEAIKLFLIAIEDDEIIPSKVNDHKQNEQKSHKRRHYFSARYGITNFKYSANSYIAVISYSSDSSFPFNWDIVIQLESSAQVIFL